MTRPDEPPLVVVLGWRWTREGEDVPGAGVPAALGRGRWEGGGLGEVAGPFPAA